LQPRRLDGRRRADRCADLRELGGSPSSNERRAGFHGAAPFVMTCFSRSGLTEISPVNGSLAAAKRDPNSSELIKAVIADFETSEGRSNIQNAMRERFAQAAPAECVQRSLASLREVSAIVDAKAPDNAAAFKTWLSDISQKVAEASVEGSFFGFGGVRV